MTVVANVAAIVATVRQELRVLHAELIHGTVAPRPGDAAPIDKSRVDPLYARNQDLYRRR